MTTDFVKLNRALLPGVEMGESLVNGAVLVSNFLICTIGRFMYHLADPSE